MIHLLLKVRTIGDPAQLAWLFTRVSARFNRNRAEARRCLSAYSPSASRCSIGRPSGSSCARTLAASPTTTHTNFSGLIAARAAINPEKFVWVVVGDAAKVRAQLEPLGLPIEQREAEGE